MGGALDRDACVYHVLSNAGRAIWMYNGPAGINIEGLQQTRLRCAAIAAYIFPRLLGEMYLLR